MEKQGGRTEGGGEEAGGGEKREGGGGGGGLPEPQAGRRDGAGWWDRGARSIPGWVQLSGKVQVFLLLSEPRKPDALKEVKRAPKKEQGLTGFAFPVAARCLPRSSAGRARGGGERHWGSWRRSLKAQAERQERSGLKSWFAASTELWN